MFSFGKTYIRVHYDFSRSTVILEPKPIQKDSKMLPKCFKNHPKMMQKVSLNIAWSKHSLLYTQTCPKGPQREPK
jgi:hypothetical protein